MKRLSLTTLFLCALLGVLARSAPAELGARPSPSKVVFPTQTVPLSFSHVEHLALKLGCDFCHDAAPGSTRASDNLIPREEVCSSCHQIERDQPDKQVARGEPDAKCVSCHPGWPAPSADRPAPPRVVVPEPNLKFNHKVHVDRRIRCQDCHGDLLAEQVGLATRDNLPRMTLCLGCHDGKQATAKCTTCHLSEAGGRIRTELPQGTLTPSGVLRGDAHDLAFRRDHRQAGADEKYCANCHKREFCVDCHDGVTRPMDLHGNDYVTIHAVDARRNEPDCSACHRLQTFCTGCHARTGVNDDSKTSEFQRATSAPTGAARNAFHAGRWVTQNGNARAASDHSFEAQRNIRACASCHRETFCLDCHAQANPHPASWVGSKRCESLLARNRRVCLRCHVTTRDIGCESML